MVKQLSDENGVETFVSLRAGNGICIIAIRGDIPSIANAIENMRTFISKLGGHLIVQEAPFEVKKGFDIWGNIGSGLGIMKRIKANYDPNNLLNPGRYI